MKKTHPFYIASISSFEGTSYKNLDDTATRSFISQLVLALSFSINFQIFIQDLLEKKNWHEFSFFNRFTQTPLPPPPSHPLNNQNLLGMKKVFCQHAPLPWYSIQFDHGSLDILLMFQNKALEGFGGKSVCQS